MKYIFILAMTLSVGIISAQSNATVTVTAGETFARAANANLSSYGGFATFFNPKKAAQGSVHLFKGWKNYAVIITNDDQKFSLNNINLNIERNTFESKISGDSLFTFNFNNIDRFVVNNRVFKNLYHNNENRVFEMVYESDEFSVMKGYRVQLIEGSTNPMVNRKNSKLVQRSSYYVKKGSRIKSFKLSKKKVLGLVEGNQERINKIEQYVKANRLSYKKSFDVQRMLAFSASSN